MSDYQNQSNSQSSTPQSLLNVLIHEYLTKNNFPQTAMTFKNEAGIAEYADTTSNSVLLEWFRMFNEICMVRSGSTSDFENLARIEAIMLRLENEKMRYYNVTKDKNFDNDKMRMLPMMRRQPRYGREQEVRYPVPPRFNERRPQRNDYASDDFRREYEDYRRMSAFSERDMRQGDARAEMRGMEMREGMRTDTRDVTFRDPVRPELKYDPREAMRDNPPTPGNNYGYNSLINLNLETRRQSAPDSKFEDVKETKKVYQNSLKEINSFFFDQKISCSASTNNLLFVALSDRTVQIINLLSMKIVGSFEPHAKPVVEIKVLVLNDESLFEHKSMDEQSVSGGETGEKVLLCTNSREKEIKVFRASDDGSMSNVCAVLPRNVAFTSALTKDWVYTVDLDGEFCKFDITGALKERVMMDEGVKQLVHYKDDLFIVNTRERVHVYDYAKRESIRDLSNEPALLIVHYNDLFALLHRDMVVIFGSDLKRLNAISVVNRMNSLAVLDENNVFVGVYRQIYWHSFNSLITNEKHSGTITALEICNLFGRTVIISMSQTGECKVWEISF
ncbi:putative WD40/YVTN repeat-like domain, LisH dimerization motif protein [Trachipleistophora hominis]|uniref:Putative WD40/YVTN repeat-like domain, LisH dimerization motif protein n=1 Tax=Trachipleistophora hominis TaxID=72359 RepID=L7K0G8_TRAHO|nr:putative WD40/YVTN repeat-like domain, LisH dimerization motif protein [Trachipleistophora hominis]